MASRLFETIEAAGQDFGLKLCGLHTLHSCRIEKACRHFGHDITDEDHVLKAGLGFAVKTDKPEFIGCDAVLRKKDNGLARRRRQFQLTDSEQMLYHNETIFRDGQIISDLTSGNYGHHLGASIGLGYVPCEGETAAEILQSKYEIEVAGDRFSEIASIKPLYNPKSERVKV